MADDIAIKVSGVSKTFKLPHEKHTSIKSVFINFYKRKRGYEKQQVLNDISFEIKKGEFFGIVGRNGSGKSTLLKLLAGIYTPDTGQITVNGKLTPFIELGVGFNPELSGRENVFLNGALLGFNRKEMEAMYDEIVAFAELERFMDQKLKNYSSGMQVRLAFSIAIRAQTDILVLDEVLAVGDEAFQNKCTEYFAKIKNSNKTVVLVTHDMGAVRRFCDKALLISEGEIRVNGLPDEAANQYTKESFGNAADELGAGGYPIGLSETVPEFKVYPASNTVVESENEFLFDIKYKISSNTKISVAFSIVDLTRSVSVLEKRSSPIQKKGKNSFSFSFDIKNLNDGDFMITAVIDEEGDTTRNRIAFTNESNICKFAIRGRGGKQKGLLKESGKWIGSEKVS